MIPSEPVLYCTIIAQWGFFPPICRRMEQINILKLRSYFWWVMLSLCLKISFVPSVFQEFSGGKISQASFMAVCFCCWACFSAVTCWHILVSYPFCCCLWGLYITIAVTHRRVIFFHTSAGFQRKNYRWRAEMPYCCTWKLEEENQWVWLVSYICVAVDSVEGQSNWVLRFWAHCKAAVHPRKEEARSFCVGMSKS